MNKNDIIQAAIEIASENGWAKASVRNISKRINYSTIKIYSEFGDKEGLMSAIQKEGFGKLRAVMLAAIEKEKTPEEQFIALNLVYYDFTKTYRAYYELMFQMNGTNCSKVEGSTLRHTSEPIRSLISQISGQPTTKSQFFNWWAIMHGFVAITDGNYYTNEHEAVAILKDMIKRFIFALKSKPAQK